jgi:hypothetical protein
LRQYQAGPCGNEQIQIRHVAIYPSMPMARVL